MAIIIENTSKCPLCGDVLSKDKPYRLFPPLTNNTLDPLYILSDAGAHLHCLTKPHHKKLMELYNAVARSIMPPAQMLCRVDGKRIQSPDNLLFIGILTSNKLEPLYQFNNIALNKQNICLWKDKPQFLMHARNYLNAGKWVAATEFNYLEYLITEIDTCK